MRNLRSGQNPGLSASPVGLEQLAIWDSKMHFMIEAGKVDMQVAPYAEALGKRVTGRASRAQLDVCFWTRNNSLATACLLSQPAAKTSFVGLIILPV